jgi:hypothetical protein
MYNYIAMLGSLSHSFMRNTNDGGVVDTSASTLVKEEETSADEVKREEFRTSGFVFSTTGIKWTLWRDFIFFA